MTAEEQAKALADDIIRQYCNHSLGIMNWEEWKPIWRAQLTEQFAKALRQAHREGMLEAASLVDNGRFLHNDAPDARFARTVSCVIRTRADQLAKGEE